MRHVHSMHRQIARMFLSAMLSLGWATAGQSAKLQIVRWANLTSAVRYVPSRATGGLRSTNLLPMAFSISTSSINTNTSQCGKRMLPEQGFFGIMG